MKRLLILLALASLPMFAGATYDDTKAVQLPPVVSVISDGLDVRSVLHNLFTSAKKSYVMDPNVRYSLYLSLQNVDFDEALQIVCQTASLSVEVQNGIYYVKPAPTKSAAPTGAATKSLIVAARQKPKGVLPESILNKRLTTRFVKADIRDLFAQISHQTAVAILVDADVPAYKLDAVLLKTSLKYALSQVCDATGLKYKFTNNLSLEIYRPVSENHVAVVKG